MADLALHVRNCRVLLREEPEGGYTVFVPALPGWITNGENITEAIAMAREAIDLYPENSQAHDEEIPISYHSYILMVV